MTTSETTSVTWPESVPVPDAPALKLLGSNGNAFVILGKAQNVARKAGWSTEQIEAFQAIAMDGDYDHLLQTCMRYFDVSKPGLAGKGKKG